MTTPVSTPPKQEIGHAGIQPPPSWSWFGTSSGGQWGTQDPDEIPQLQWPLNVHVYHRMRTDSQVDALIRSVTMPVRNLNWSIDPNGARDEVTEHIAQTLNLPILNAPDAVKRGRKRFNHDEHMRLALLAPTVYGHMFFEQTGDIITTPEGQLRWKMSKLAPRMPQSITKITVARDGGLESITQQDGVTMNPPPIPVTSLAAYVWEREGANWTGRSMMRPLYKHYLIKDRMIRVDAIKNERFGAGIPKGTAHPGGDPADYQKMASAIRAVESGGVGVPNGGDIGVDGIRGVLPDTLATIRYHDEAMARSFLAMFMQLGTTQTGSRALGDTMLDFFTGSLSGFADWYAGTTNEHVIEDIVDWNWGEDEQAPLLVWGETEEQPLSADELANLVYRGALVVDEELEGWIRKHYGMPQRDPNSPIVISPQDRNPDAPVTARSTTTKPGTRKKTPKVTKASQASQPAQPSQSPSPELESEPTATTGPAATSHRPGAFQRHTHASSQTLARPGTVGHREPTAVEAASNADFAQIQQQWEDEVTRLVSAWQGVRTSQIDDLVAQVEAAVDAGDAEALANIQAEVQGADLLLDHARSMASDAIDAAVAEASAQGVTIAATSLDDVAPVLEARANATAVLLSRSLSQSAARQALNRYGVDAITAADVAAAVKDHLTGLTDAYLNDMLGGMLTGAQNTGRLSVMKQEPATYYASELLDQNTCEACAGVDGTDYASIDEATMDYPTGGYSECLGGDRCRGTLVAVYDEGNAASAA